MNSRHAVTDSIINLRKHLSLTQGQFAAKMGTSLRTVAHWEAGRLPGFKFLTMLAITANRSGCRDMTGAFNKELDISLNLDPASTPSAVGGDDSFMAGCLEVRALFNKVVAAVNGPHAPALDAHILDRQPREPLPAVR